MVASTMLCASLLLMGFLAPSVLTAPTPSTVLTPHGQRPITNVHLVPEGGEVKHVGSEIHLLDATGKVLHVAQNDNAKVKPTSTSSSVEPLETGWIAYASWYNSGSDPISSFTTSWTVPAVPAANDGQTLFYFNSIEPASYDAILQPVLQYGGSAAGGGAYWAVASWYLVGSNTYYTTPVQVNAGDNLDGIITLTSTDGTNYDYVTSFTNVDGTSLTASNSAELVWATETLEVYGVQSLSDFPTGSTVFNNINIATSAGTPSVSWSPVSDSSDGITTDVTTDGATNAVITINY